MSFKRIIFWSHLVVGLATGLVIFVLALTGVILTYEMQIKALFDPKVAPTVEHSEMLSSDELIALARPAFAGSTATLDYYRDSAKPMSVKAGRHEAKLIDPYKGVFIETETNPTEAFFETVEELHRSLAMGRDSSGSSIVKAANLGFAFIVVTGIYLWLPRRWKWPFLKQKILFASKSPTAKARDYNWHHVFSFWVLIPLLAVVGTGVIISYPAVNDLVFQSAGLQAPQGRGQGKGMWAKSSAGGASAMSQDQLVSYQSLYEKARLVDEDWQTISIIIPTSDKAKQVDILIDSGNGKQVATQQQVTYSRETGDVIKTLGPEELATPTQSLKRYIRFLHSGEVYGIVGQTLAGLASLASLFLVWTGFALAWRRLISPLFIHKATPSLH